MEIAKKKRGKRATPLGAHLYETRREKRECETGKRYSQSLAHALLSAYAYDSTVTAPAIRGVRYATVRHSRWSDGGREQNMPGRKIRTHTIQ